MQVSLKLNKEEVLSTLEVINNEVTLEVDELVQLSPTTYALVFSGHARGVAWVLEELLALEDLLAEKTTYTEEDLW